MLFGELTRRVCYMRDSMVPQLAMDFNKHYISHLYFYNVYIQIEMRCYIKMASLQWRHNGHDGVSNHQLYDCLLNRLFSCSSKKTPKLRVTGLCAGNSPVTGEFPAQRASNAENVSI